jgi:hypothetical protein
MRSANTALDGMVRNLDNAFTFVLPAVLDSGGLASESREQGGRLGHLTVRYIHAITQLRLICTKFVAAMGNVSSM